MIFKESGNAFKKGATLLMVFFLVVSFSFVPQKVQAQFIVTDIFKMGWDVAKKAWEHGGAIAYHNALSYVLQQMAKQTGEWLAEGGKGKKPLFWTDPKEFFEKAGDQVLGEFIDGMASSFLGQSLCDNLDYTVKFNILANLDPNYAQTKWAEEPECSFSQMKKNLEKMKISNMAEFSTELKEGKVDKQESMITTLIQGDSVLTSEQKIWLDGELDTCPEPGSCPEGEDYIVIWDSHYYEIANAGAAAYLHSYTQKFKDILEELKAISEGETEGQKQHDVLEGTAVRKFKDLQDKLAPDTGPELWGDGEVYSPGSNSRTGLKALNEVSAECVRNSQQICDNPDCVALCHIGGTNNCQSDESTCLDRLKRIKSYSNQLVEWASTIQDMTDRSIANWEAREAIPDLDPLTDAEFMFNPESNPIGIQMSLESKLFAQQTEAIEKSKFFRQLQGSMNAVTSKVSGLVKWPSTLVDEKTRDMVEASQGSIAETTGVAAADALNVLASTFLQQFMKRIMKGSLNPALDSGGVTVPSDPDAPPANKVISVLSGIEIVPLSQSSQEMTIYDEFTVCPSGTDQKHISQFNCLIDNKLSRAMEEKLTLAEAMERDFLSPSERLGVEGQSNSLLAESNLKKLRLLGIIPLGLEIAHKKIIEEQYSNGLPLSEVIAGFNQRGEDGICGTLDQGESPFCNLVDPNWVLRADSYLCELTGYSAIPGRDSVFRQESCLDFKTCISESEESCDTWSYCTRAKNVWRFDGDECDAQYSSCTSYVNQNNGKTYSYLANTLNFENCDSNNVGCQWYCSDWDPVYSGVENWSCAAPGWRKYNCNLGSPCETEAGCDCSCDGDNGCPSGIGSCLVAEGATYCTLEKPHPQNTIFFSSHVDDCKETEEGCSQYIRTTPGLGVNFLVNGSFELGVNSGGAPLGWSSNQEQLISKFNPEEGSIPNGNNVLRIQGEGGPYGIFLKQEVNNISPSSSNLIISGYYKDVDSSVSGDNKLRVKACYDSGCSDFDLKEKPIDLEENQWKYNVLTISLNKNKSIDHLVVEAIRNAVNNFSGILYLDSFQVRNESGNSSYREYGSHGNVYLKSAPQWMNCYDTDSSNDHADCVNFISLCSAEEVGCELYTSVSNQGDIQIPAIVQESDQCPSTCVGYETFEEIGSFFDPRVNRWVEMIPQTARKCLAPGCEAFTNLDFLAQGGEAEEYYTYLRQCVKVNQEGLAIIDSAGEEISPASNDTCQYYYTWIGEEESGYQLRSYYLEKDSNLGGPLQVSSSPNPSWGECDENNLDNPHCRQFYDDEGNVYYRFYKNTISCSQDCKPYRREIDDEIYMAIGTEGEVCRPQDLGCREYKGAAYGSMRNLFEDKFLNENSLAGWERVELSTESLDRFGYSLQANDTYVKKPASSYLKQGGVYSLKLWVKGGGNYRASLGSVDFLQGESQAVVSEEWQEIKFGTIYFNQELSGDENLIIYGPNEFYLDNISLNKVEDDLYLIKDSWDTPQICDLDADGNISPGYMVGCRAYQDRVKNYHYFKSFSRLCSSEAAGCEALINTYNSSSPFSEQFNSGSPDGDELTVLADATVYRIYDSEYSCAAEKKGCQKFGQPEFSEEEEVVGYQDVFLINDPDAYQLQSILCDFSGWGCQEYNGPVYFKDPGSKVCEYRENVSLYGETKNGWFKQGTNNPCYLESGLAYQPYGSVYGIRFNDDPLYDGWAGICPGGQDGCTQFIDPLAQNLILNSGLEEDVNEDGVPDHWDSYALPDSFDLQNNGCLSGQCWFVDTTSDTAAASQYIKINPGSTYELSAWVKAREGSTGSVKIYLAYVDQKPSGDWIDVVSVANDNDLQGKWEKLSVSLIAPLDAQYARVLVPYVSDLMEVHVDNISLIEKNSSKGSYYFINNDNLDRSSCAGMVGVKDGCILFNDTSLSGRLPYDSASTYALSQENNDLAVPVSNIPVGSGAEGDSNLILKVKRDRVCGEWLHCSGSYQVWDSSIDDYRQVCDSWVRCDQLIGEAKNAQCGHVVYDPNPQVLTPELYQERNVSWKGMDYVGYSLLGTYPVERLTPTENELKYQLTYFDQDGNDLGIDNQGTILDKSVHVYPEKDSPFKKNAGEYYNKVNLCNSSEEDDASSLYPDCQGVYKKVEYGDQYSGQTKYFNFDDSGAADQGVCRMSGEECGDDETDCITAGDECLPPLRVTDAVGLRGFCLEPDESKPDEIDACITWWPGAAVGDMDVFNMYYSAGYVPPAATKWYCASDDSGDELGIARQACDYNCKRGFGGSYSKYIGLSDSQSDWRVNGKSGCGGDDINSGIFRLGEIEKIEVYIFADDGTSSGSCTSPHCQGYVTLNKETGWWRGIKNNDQGSCNKGNGEGLPTSFPSSFPLSAPDGGGSTSVKACFNEACDSYDDDDYLHHFEIKLEEDNSGSDATGGFGRDDGTHGVRIYLKGCQYVVNAIPGYSDGLAIAYTDRLWEYDTDYYLDHYGNQKCEPYGAVNATNPERLIMTGALGNDCEEGKANIVYNQNGLQNLFVKVDEVKEFNSSIMKYEPLDSGSWSSWDLRDAAGSPGEAPQISSLEENGSKFTIGQYDSGDVGPEQSPYVANFKFYAWADANHMPLREISIDWDDDTVSFRNVISKNHKPICDGTTDFGSIEETCVDKYFSFNHTYLCQRNSSSWEAYDCENMCCFKPKVHLKDNWNWCLGGKYAKNDGNCKDKEDAGILYDGLIKVRPQ
ncbi:carbohydrate binding domain-containing protein [Patescibacteria group bacterium]|nr:carbohydrate binding domain-containing protein [Patescibacteria group bacterium]